jgi:hypothetical protein
MAQHPGYAEIAKAVFTSISKCIRDDSQKVNVDSTGSDSDSLPRDLNQFNVKALGMDSNRFMDQDSLSSNSCIPCPYDDDDDSLLDAQEKSHCDARNDSCGDFPRATIILSSPLNTTKFQNMSIASPDDSDENTSGLMLSPSKRSPMRTVTFSPSSLDDKKDASIICVDSDSSGDSLLNVHMKTGFRRRKPARKNEIIDICSP